MGPQRVRHDWSHTHTPPYKDVKSIYTTVLYEINEEDGKLRTLRKERENTAFKGKCSKWKILCFCRKSHFSLITGSRLQKKEAMTLKLDLKCEILIKQRNRIIS